LNSTEITILDAGMGKTLAMRGVEIPGTIWSANALIVAPEVVLDIHHQNIDAGARIITTNSYGIIRTDLAKENIEDRFAELNHKAGELAQRAAEDSGKAIEIAGSLPPLNGSYRPDRVLDSAIIEPLYREQANILSEYVDYFLCETLSTIEEALAATRAAQSTGKPVLVSVTLHDDEAGCLRSGESIIEAISQLCELKPLGILVNCCLPERISDVMPVLGSAGLEFTGGYANAFSRVPTDWLLDGIKESDRKLDLRDDLSPELYCKFAQHWLDQGANIIGGCCGTTAEHTKALNSLR